MAFYAIFKYTRAYSSITQAIPVAVALWDESGVTHFRALSAGEEARGIHPDTDRRYVDLAIERLHDRMERGAVSKRVTMGWWTNLRAELVHSLLMSEPLAIDLPATKEGLAKLWEDTMRPFRIPAVLPPNPSTDLYAQLRDDGTYYHFFPHPRLVESCSSEPITVHKVRVQPDDNGRYWGWWDAERQCFTMIWPSRTQFEMCFPYGPEAEERRGRGLICRLSAMKIEDV